jgi:hypothetical protein
MTITAIGRHNNSWETIIAVLIPQQHLRDHRSSRETVTSWETKTEKVSRLLLWSLNCSHDLSGLVLSSSSTATSTVSPFCVCLHGLPFCGCFYGLPVLRLSLTVYHFCGCLYVYHCGCLYCTVYCISSVTSQPISRLPIKSTSPAAVSTVSSSAAVSTVFKFFGFLYGLPVRWRSLRSNSYAASSVAKISAADSAVCEICGCLYGLQYKFCSSLYGLECCL